MKPPCFLFSAGLLLAATACAYAQSPTAPTTLRYRFTPGQTLRYTIQRDPYFADPNAAFEAANGPNRPPIVERLTEDVLAVDKDGTATLKITLEPEPGFADGPSVRTIQTVTVTPLGKIVSAPRSDFLHSEFLTAFFQLPTAQPQKAWVTESHSHGHDGLLQQTTRSVQRDSVVFDQAAGNLRRQTSARTMTRSLVMLERGTRGADDFGRVIPKMQVVQTMTIERRDDLLSNN